MTARPKKGSMRGLEPENQAKGPFPFSFEPLNGFIGHQIIHITFVGLRWADFTMRTFLDHRPEIISRSSRVSKIIIPLALPELSDMCLAECRHFITCFAQIIGEKRNFLRNDAPLVINASGVVGIKTGQLSGTPRKAKGIHDKRITKLNSFAPDAVKIWCVDNLIPIQTERMGAMAIGGDKNEVRPRRIPCRRVARPQDRRLLGCKAQAAQCSRAGLQKIAS